MAGIYILDIIIESNPDGLVACKEILERDDKSIVIFVSNYPELIFTDSFYKINSFNIIMKYSPDFFDELKFTIEEAIKFQKNKNLLIEKNKFCRILIDISGIYYIETVKGKHKTLVYHENGTYELNKGINEVIRLLPDSFVRCHRAFIVNKDKIISIEYKERKILLEKSRSCCYSRKYKKELGI